MDKRTDRQKWLWEHVGPPLYYCEECMLEVQVTEVQGAEPLIKRPCSCNASIIAPRRAIAIGKGGASMQTKAKVAFYRLLAAMTKRCV